MNRPPRKSLLKKVFLIEKAIKNWFQESTGAENSNGDETRKIRLGEKKNFNTIRFFKHGSPRIKKISIKKLISGVFWFGERTFSMHKDFVHREMNYRAYPNGKSLENKVKKFTTPFF